jgi:hypothetical protein
MMADVTMVASNASQTLWPVLSAAIYVLVARWGYARNRPDEYRDINLYYSFLFQEIPALLGIITLLSFLLFVFSKTKNAEISIANLVSVLGLLYLVTRSDAFLEDAPFRPKKWGVYLVLTWGVFVALIAFLVVLMPSR